MTPREMVLHPRVLRGMVLPPQTRGDGTPQTPGDGPSPRTTQVKVIPPRTPQGQSFPLRPCGRGSSSLRTPRGLSHSPKAWTGRIPLFACVGALPMCLRCRHGLCRTSGSGATGPKGGKCLLSAVAHGGVQGGCPEKAEGLRRRGVGWGKSEGLG